ncbi:type II toxin-antitoxin system PemK/MazF family toxin [Apilactobacillus quenuiae]|uniref:type II toxin-antitoxin system PemK/MazF family toxin n=1 Tax=Apilactobacillus quenuiae TaxID=2008377 RepID=UPI000D0130B7|nr:type II toxin-antitoxin system PemK/MazF family toxin [Apilactobacillus quenuiae]
MQEAMDIYIADVPYDYKNKSKRRPALVVAINNNYVTVFKITSKYNKKSAAIQKIYYPIKEWQKAGLKKQSYVDTHITYSITRAEVFKRQPLGKLSDNDTINLYQFINDKS